LLIFITTDVEQISNKLTIFAVNLSVSSFVDFFEFRKFGNEILYSRLSTKNLRQGLKT